MATLIPTEPTISAIRPGSAWMHIQSYENYEDYDNYVFSPPEGQKGVFCTLRLTLIVDRANDLVKSAYIVTTLGHYDGTENIEKQCITTDLTAEEALAIIQE